MPNIRIEKCCSRESDRREMDRKRAKNKGERQSHVFGSFFTPELLFQNQIVIVQGDIILLHLTAFCHANCIINRINKT